MKILFGIFSFTTESSKWFLANWPPLSCPVLQGCARQSCSRRGSWCGCVEWQVTALVLDRVLATHETVRFTRSSKQDELETLSKNTTILKKYMNWGCLWTTGHVADVLAPCSKGPVLLS